MGSLGLNMSHDPGGAPKQEALQVEERSCNGFIDDATTAACSRTGDTSRLTTARGRNLNEVPTLGDCGPTRAHVQIFPSHSGNGTPFAGSEHRPYEMRDHLGDHLDGVDAESWDRNFTSLHMCCIFTDTSMTSIIST